MCLCSYPFEGQSVTDCHARQQNQGNYTTMASHILSVRKYSMHCSVRSAVLNNMLHQHGMNLPTVYMENRHIGKVRKVLPMASQAAFNLL